MSNRREPVAPTRMGNNLGVEITLPLHMAATCNHCPLPESPSKTCAFPPLPNKTWALPAPSPPDENTLPPNLAASGSEQVTNGTETAAASSPETEKCYLRGRHCETGPFAARTFGQRAHIWPFGAQQYPLGIWAGCQAICPAASPLGCDEQPLIQRLQQNVLATSIHSTPSSDFINAVELWDSYQCWHSPGKE